MPIKPTRKVTGAGLGGAAAILIVWVLSEFGIDIPGEPASALTTVLAFAGGWLVKE